VILTSERLAGRDWSVVDDPNGSFCMLFCQCCGWHESFSWSALVVEVRHLGSFATQVSRIFRCKYVCDSEVVGQKVDSVWNPILRRVENKVVSKIRSIRGICDIFRYEIVEICRI
jgi:hypothetical protein